MSCYITIIFKKTLNSDYLQTESSDQKYGLEKGFEFFERFTTLYCFHIYLKNIFKDKICSLVYKVKCTQVHILIA